MKLQYRTCHSTAINIMDAFNFMQLIEKNNKVNMQVITYGDNTLNYFK